MPPYEPRKTPVLVNPRGFDEDTMTDGFQGTVPWVFDSKDDDKKVHLGMMIERVIKDAFRRMTLHYEKGFVSGASVFIHTGSDEGYIIREDFDWCDPHKRYRCGEEHV